MKNLYFKQYTNKQDGTINRKSEGFTKLFNKGMYNKKRHLTNLGEESNMKYGFRGLSRIFIKEAPVLCNRNNGNLIINDKEREKNMKLKKTLVTLAACALMLGSLTACGDKKEETTAAAQETTAAAEKSENAGEVFMTFNGVDVHIRADFASIKDSLGTEVKPAETIEPCDGGDYIQIMHYYDGLTITTLRDEIVIGLEIADGNGAPALMGKVKVGDTPDAVKSALGDPENEDEFSLSYNIDGAQVMVYLDNGAVSGSIVINMQ